MASYISTTFLRENSPNLDLSRYSDATVSGIISRASALVDNYTQRSFSLQSVSSEKHETIIENDGNLVIYPKVTPIVSVSDITITMGSFSTTLTLTSAGSSVLEIPETLDVITFPNEGFALTTATRAVSLEELRKMKTFTKVSYIGGYETIPGDIEEATMLYSVDIISRQQNTSGAQSITQGAVSVSYSDSRGKSEFAKDAEAILNKYVRLF